MKRWLRFSSALVLHAAAAVAVASGMVACDGADPAPVAEGDITNILVTAETVEAVPAGQNYIVDLGRERVRYHFDFRKPIAWDRVALRSPASVEAGMTAALDQMKAEGRDPLEASDLRFILVRDPAYFTELRESELAELRETGLFIKEKGSAPAPQPQSLDDCVEEVVYTEVVIEVNGQLITVWCAHVIVECPPDPCEPATEICNGADDDCDGEVDEDSDVACSSACGSGVQACVNGQLTICDAPEPVPVGDQTTLTGTLRDFTDAHPDFEDYLGVDPGIVLSDLGADDKPVYAGQAGNPSTHGQGAFDQWYRDVPGVNQSTPLTITLTKQAGSNVYTYNNSSFFPLDGQLFGNQGRSHNYHFTFELNTPFYYSGGEVFTFTGDDDLFVFINNRLAIDLGGVHPPQSATINMDAKAAELGIVPGTVYNMRLFFAERHTVLSNFRIDTTIGQFYTCQ